MSENVFVAAGEIVPVWSERVFVSRAEVECVSAVKDADASVGESLPVRLTLGLVVGVRPETVVVGPGDTVVEELCDVESDSLPGESETDIDADADRLNVCDIVGFDGVSVRLGDGLGPVGVIDGANSHA